MKCKKIGDNVTYDVIDELAVLLIINQNNL